MQKIIGIPQNRERCFMVSILNGKKFKFPDKQPLTLRLKDMLEDNVDEKYYLKSRYITDRLEIFPNEDIIANMNYSSFVSTNKIYNINGIAPSLRACEHLFDNLNCTKIGCIKNNQFTTRLLTEKEHLRLMGIKDKEIDKFSVNANQQIKQARK